MPSVPKENEFIGMPAKVTAILESESDRGTILVLAAYLDEILGLIVRGACVTDADADKILEYRGPAGGFDLKIQLCKALALIHEDEVSGLDAVRRIRNSAAHFDSKSRRGFDVLFDSNQTIDLVNNLAKSQRLTVKTRDPKAVRSLFVSCVRFLATKLYYRLLVVSRPKPLDSTKAIADALREEFKANERGRELLEMIDNASPDELVELSRNVCTDIGTDVRNQLEKRWTSEQENDKST